MRRAVVVRLYAGAREAAGTARIDLPVGPEGISLGTALDRLVTRHPPLGTLLSHCRFARNGEYVRGRTTRVGPGDELAIHPPFSGG